MALPARKCVRCGKFFTPTVNRTARYCGRCKGR